MIWEDPSFNKLSIQARFIFIGMISNADDEGFIRSDIGSIKRLLFGFDDTTKDEITNWGAELGGLKNIHFYSVNEESYAHFLNWSKYQKQQQDRIQKSGYPPCSKCVASDKQMLTKVKRSKEKRSKENLPPSAEKDMYKLQPDNPDKTIDIDSLEESSELEVQRKAQKGYDPKDTNLLLVWGAEKLGRKFTKPLKQKKHIADMLAAGNTPEAIKAKWEELEDDNFWASKGIDFTIVSSQIDKVRIESKPNPLLYAPKH